MKKLFTLVLSLVAFTFANASDRNYWKEISKEQASAYGKQNTEVRTCSYQVLDLKAMTQFLKNAPMERTSGTALILDLPMADGSFQQFRIVESPVMEAGLMAKYPLIKTYAGQGIDDATATIRLDITEAGFHAMILATGNSVFIDPVNFQNIEAYIVYNKSDAIPSERLTSCGFNSEDLQNANRAAELNDIVALNGGNTAHRSSGDTLRTYRLALACTGEYATSFGAGPTISSTLGHMVTSVNRVNSVYEKEIAIHLNLIANTDLLINLVGGASDPYTNNDGSTMLGENQTKVNNTIGSLNYDIGHVFSTGGGGIAELGCVCKGTSKARGVTGSPSPTGDAFDIDYVAHEMGHQFGGNHPFNGTTGFCGGGNRNSSTAYETGSGSTVMAYAGICSSGSYRDDLQPHSDAYFHTISFDEIRNYTTLTAPLGQFNGNTCPVKTVTANHPPVVTSLGGSAYTIPMSTPFTLTGDATDVDGDVLTYCWEEFDLGNACNANVPAGNAPAFRSLNPTTSPARTFPRPSIIILNYPVQSATSYKYGETLPTYTRNMKFRLTVRDNRSVCGGVTYDPAFVTVSVDATKGPLAVTQPNTALTWPGNSIQNITWDVNSTDQAPINTANVNILLSVDSGKTFPYVLATNVPNNGLAAVTIPGITTAKARVKVEAVGNIYFDMSNTQFSISTPIGLNENDLSSESVNVYPNPSAGVFSLSWAGIYQGEIDVQILDVTGRVVLSKKINKVAAGVIETLDLGKPAAGVYTLEAKTKSGLLVKKLVVE